MTNQSTSVETATAAAGRCGSAASSTEAGATRGACCGTAQAAARAGAGWAAPDPDTLPTGADVVEEYLETLAKLPAIAAHLRLDARVVAISREGVDRVRTAGREQAPFVVRLADGTDLLARAVIDASGT